MRGTGRVLVTFAAVGAVLAPTAQATSPIASSPAGCRDADLAPARGNLDRVQAATLCLINAERRQAGEVPVGRSGRLDASAGYHSTEMVRHHFLDHQRAGLPTLLERIQASGYFAGAREGLYGENIGVGPGVNGTAEALVDAWMSSPPHRANILLPQWRDIGIGTAMAPPDRAFYRDFPSTVYTTDFGRRYGHRRCVTVRRAGTRRRRRYCRR